MHLFLDDTSLQGWLNQLGYSPVSSFLVKEGLSLVHQSQETHLSLGLQIAQSLTSPDWFNEVLERRYLNFARYHQYIPMAHPEGSWTLYSTLSPHTKNNQVITLEHVLPLFYLAGIHVNTP